MVKGSETPYAAIVMTTDCGDLKKVRPGELVEDQSRSRFQAQTTRAVRRDQRRTRRSHLKNWVTLFVVSFKLCAYEPVRHAHRMDTGHDVRVAGELTYGRALRCSFEFNRKAATPISTAMSNGEKSRCQSG